MGEGGRVADISWGGNWRVVCLLEPAVTGPGGEHCARIGPLPPPPSPVVAPQLRRAEERLRLVRLSSELSVSSSTASVPTCQISQ